MDVENYYFGTEGNRIVPYNKVDYIVKQDSENLAIRITGTSHLYSCYLKNSDNCTKKLNHYIN